MSQYYAPKRTRNLYNPNSTDPFALSRSKIDLFLNCPKCFYLDQDDFNSAVNARDALRGGITYAYPGTSHCEEPKGRQSNLFLGPTVCDELERWFFSGAAGVSVGG